MTKGNPLSDELVRVEDLRVHFTRHEGWLQRREAGIIRAVDGVSFTLRQGEVLALVGAARSGKTTVARAVALLERPTTGRVLFQGQDVATWRGRRLKRRRRQIQLLYSNPYIAFAPHITVEGILREAIQLSEPRFGRRPDERLVELMAQVGLNAYLSVRYPRDLSGGNRQRLAVARALAPRPDLLVCDQPTDHVDPVMGEAIVDLLHELQQELGLTMLFTARQLVTARHADRVAVMVMGRIVEMGHYADLIRQPLHPFTQALLEPPVFDLHDRVARSLDPLRLGGGCHYAPVCPLAEALCREDFPAFVEGAPGHGVACHLVEPLIDA